MSLLGPDTHGEGGVTDRSDEATPDHGGTATSEEPQAAEGPRHRKEPKRRKGGFFTELPVLVLVAFVLALLLKTFLVQAFYIPSESMLPTLEVGDRVLVNKLAHDFREPRRGEVIVFRQENGVPASEEDGNPFTRVVEALGSGLGFVQSGEKDFIKRLIALPGETIEMRDGVVYIDGEPIPEAASENGGYLSRPDLIDFGPVTVPDGEYFFMGDNRPNSSDSRSMLGTIREEDIVGRAFAVVWPFDRLATLSIADYEGEAAAADAGDGDRVDE